MDTYDIIKYLESNMTATRTNIPSKIPKFTWMQEKRQVSITINKVTQNAKLE